MSATSNPEASAGLRHLDMADARLRRRETREWAREHPEFLAELNERIGSLIQTVNWLEAK